jgi:hypothetical protein
MPHRRALAAVLLVIACGPKASSEDDGASTAGTTDLSTTDPVTTTVSASTGIIATSTTTEPESTSDDTGIVSGSTNETGITCAAPEQYVPGCGEPSPSSAVIEPGCYVQCDEHSPCETGLCMLAWIDPCYGAACGACGGEQGLCLDDLPTGSPCGADEHCTSGVCWDFNDYDPCCFGTVCSGPCETDDECIELAQVAEAPDPPGAQCGPDGRCDLMGAGLGSFACAGPMCG